MARSNRIIDLYYSVIFKISMLSKRSQMKETKYIFSVFLFICNSRKVYVFMYNNNNAMPRDGFQDERVNYQGA